MNNLLKQSLITRWMNKANEENNKLKPDKQLLKKYSKIIDIIEKG